MKIYVKLSVDCSLFDNIPGSCGYRQSNKKGNIGCCEFNEFLFIVDVMFGCWCYKFGIQLV